MNENTDENTAQSEPTDGVVKRKRIISPIFLVVAAIVGIGLFFLSKQIMFMKMLGDEKSRASSPVVIDEDRPKPQGKAVMSPMGNGP